jgi:calmodulin
MFLGYLIRVALIFPNKIDKENRKKSYAKYSFKFMADQGEKPEK